MASKKEQEPQNTANVLLSIEDLEPERNIITIHGETYEMMTFDDFGPRQQQQVTKITRMVGRLFGDQTSDADERNAIKALEKGLKLAFPEMPEDVIAKLSYLNKLKIWVAFSRTFTKALGLNDEESQMTRMPSLTMLESIGDS